MTNEEVAKKLAAITGKSTGDFFNGKIQNDLTSNEAIKNNNVLCTAGFGDNKEKSIDGGESTAVKIKTGTEVTKELLEYQRMFAGAEIVRNTIHNGRQMTRKEYLKYTKNLTYEEITVHPLMYKMYRSEGQQEAAFPAWLDKFNKRENNDKK